MQRFEISITQIIIGIMSVLSLSSCRDTMIADTLEGTWEGNMYISTRYGGRTYDATYSEIEFLVDPFRFSSGSGYWVDYYSNAPWDYVANHTSWSVDNGVINVYFREDGSSISIRNYRLNNHLFEGVIDDGGDKVSFSLVHTSSPNWNDRSWRWGYDGWGTTYYGYSKEGSETYSKGFAPKDTVTVNRPIRFVRTSNK